jgi:hypothetical protein
LGCEKLIRTPEIIRARTKTVTALRGGTGAAGMALAAMMKAIHITNVKALFTKAGKPD